jgi:uncharacterized protein YukE
MANVNVTYQEMQDAATRANTGQQEIDSQLAQLKNLIATNSSVPASSPTAPARCSNSATK